MSKCQMVSMLDKLRKSSRESIDNEKEYNAFNRYMHVTREVEKELKSVLSEVNNSGKKTLVLLCGSAGDGKSHMLSYLNNDDPDKLLADYVIYNDATESNSPTSTSVDTLNEILDDFSDEKLDEQGQNMILAINLGVLNNFIESDYSNRYTELKKFVTESSILSNKINQKEIKSNYFRCVSFSDYHPYTLTKNEVKTDLFDELMEKIYGELDGNPFRDVYDHVCMACTLKKRCPVRYNYKFLSNGRMRHYIALLLVYTIVKEKEIVTVREALNYFYDITAPQSFSPDDAMNSIVNQSGTLKKFVSLLTPSLMFDVSGLTTLMDHVRKSDPLLFRNEKRDDFAIEYYVSRDSASLLEGKISVYDGFILEPQNRDIINNDAELKKNLFALQTRILAMDEMELYDLNYKEYMKYLYFYNNGEIRKLKQLYDLVKTAVGCWCGTDKYGGYRIDDMGSSCVMYEKIRFTECVDRIPLPRHEDELFEFIPEIEIAFENGQESDDQPITLKIDYTLYDFMKKLEDHYVYTIDDRNSHADFLAFINNILKTGNAENELIIKTEDGTRSMLKKSRLGFTFEVIG